MVNLDFTDETLMQQDEERHLDWRQQQSRRSPVQSEPLVRKGIYVDEGRCNKRQRSIQPFVSDDDDSMEVESVPVALASSSRSCSSESCGGSAASSLSFGNLPNEDEVLAEVS